MADLEELIIDRFNQLSDDSDIVSPTVSGNDFRLKKILENFSHPTVYKKILDVGSGKGKFTRPLKDRGFEVVGVEPAEKLIEISRQLYPDIEFVQASATRLPFPDGSFDGIICVEVLEQIPEVEQAIREMARVLRPGGLMLILDNNFRSLHPRYMIPTPLWNRFWGEDSKWRLYPRDFVFQEHHFIPRRLNQLIKKYFTDSDVEFVYYQPDVIAGSWWKVALIKLRTAIGWVLHHTLPSLDFYVLWKATK